MFLLVVFLLSISVSGSDLQSIKTKYVCPPDFHLIGRKCYHFSKNNVTWHDSHYYCQTLNSTLAVTDTHRDLNLLRDYLNKSVSALGSYERWIGGIYDWKQMKWKWGLSGQLITFNKFSQVRRGDKYDWNCIVIDPAKENRWNARKCTDRKRCICETESNTYIQFKLYNKKLKKRFNIARCSNPVSLSKYEKRKCLQLLGTIENNEPAYIIEKPRPTKSVNPSGIDGYVCPSHMVGLGNRCYYFSRNETTWMDAYYDCKRNKSKLAIVRNRPQDFNLRIFLNNFIEKHDRWIGGIYDWKSEQWKWAMTGQPLKYNGFAKGILKNRRKEDLEWNTIFMDPSLGNRWNADNEMKKKHYICQVKGRAVKKLGVGNVKPSQATISIITQ